MQVSYKYCLITLMSQRINKEGDHSLGPDIFTGWKPSQTLHQFRQFPIFFTNPPIDKLSKSLTTFGVTHLHRVVYMGPRYASNYKAFKAFSKKEEFEQQHNDQSYQYGEYFSKFQFKFLSQREKAFPIRSIQYRLFTGMNPTIKKDDLKFDANFQCGNLDLAISVSPLQYDLLMRVDSNTKGHTTWFYFKVTNFSKQKVKFNIINFQKSGLLYSCGLKPYCFRSSKKVWEQANVEVEYKNKRFRYSEDDSPDPIIQKCLSFTYQFDQEDQYVYFAYCVPYSYSYLLHQLDKLRTQFPNILTVDWNNYSTGGLIIPVLTITNPQNTENKETLLAIGRLHPGQPQGSWTIDGFIKFLCSPKATYLRQKVIFKIVPMVNVDGVVLGNFRTSISGRDLNRVFDSPEEYKQVNLVRKLAQKTKPFIFLDFHGHSAKKNVFMYGPNYSIDHKNYLTSRLYPKIISKIAKAFRFYSCIFKISECKINTGRSFMLKQHKVTFAYTVEASTFAYGGKNDETIFTQGEYSKVGGQICQSLISFFKILFKAPKRLEKQKSAMQERTKSTEPNPVLDENKVQFSQTEIVSKAALEKQTSLDENAFQSQLLSQLMQDQKNMTEQLKKHGPSQSSLNQEGSDSDFEEGCDYTDKELHRMMKQADALDTFPIVLNKHGKKKTKKNRHLEETAIPEQHNTQRLKKRITLIKQKPQELSLIKLSPVRQVQRRKVKPLNVQSISPQLAKIKSSVIQSFTSISEMQSSPASVVKQFQYKNWKRFQEEILEKDHSRFIKAQSLNRITLDYQEQKAEEMADTQKNKKQNDIFARRKVKGGKQGEKQKKNGKKQSVFYVKETVLPVLNKNTFNERRSNLSLLDQLLEHNERIQKNYARKNIKIMYF